MGGLPNLKKLSTLNKLATIPVVGIAAGVMRCALSVIHIVGHLFMAIENRDKNHLPHVVKGSAEFLRGMIETIPIVGRIFSYLMNGGIPPLCCAHCYRGGRRSFYSFFLVKIENPNRLDNIDHALRDPSSILCDDDGW